MTRRIGIATALLLLAAGPSLACSLCANMQEFLQTPTFRQEAAQPHARLIFYGTLSNPKLGANGTGTTDVAIETVIRKDPFLADKKTITLPRFLPVADPKAPPRFLFFADVFKDHLDPYRGLPLRSADAIDYVKQAVALTDKDPVKNLEFYGKYLEHADKEVATDAFLEWAKAGDREVGEAARKLAPERLRGFLKDEKTPAERLSLYAFLLGACGKDEDAKYLADLLKHPSERMRNAYDGVLTGYLAMRPVEGWDQVLAILNDGKTPLQLRLAAVRAVRFQQGWKPKESRDVVLRCMKAMLEQGELADVAVEDLRRWQMWDLTPQVLAVYGKKGYDTPILNRGIIRYALTHKADAASKAFVAARRKAEPDLVKEVEESLELEKPAQ